MSQNQTHISRNKKDNKTRNSKFLSNNLEINTGKASVLTATPTPADGNAEIVDLAKMCEFLGEYVKDFDVEKENDHYFHAKQYDVNYMDVILDFQKEPLKENNIFFINGKIYNVSNSNNREKKERIISKTGNHVLEEQVNKVTGCPVYFQEEDTEANSSDIDLYLI